MSYMFCGFARRARSVLILLHSPIMAKEIDLFYDVALKLTKQAGELIRAKVGVCLVADLKSCDIDLVTETDQAVEKLLMDGISAQFSSHKFIGEETVASGGSCNLTEEPTWIIDPIDGTMNFVHSFPHSSISLALFVDKEPHIGIIYNPMLEQLFTARKGQGAFLNGKQIFASKETVLAKALVMMENGTSRDSEKMKNLFANQQSIIPKIHGTRCLGSAALDMAMVALGCADAYFEFGIHIWDIAAGELLVKEAGGVVLDPAGSELDRFSRRVLCASTPQLAEELTANLEQFYPLPRD